MSTVGDELKKSSSTRAWLASPRAGWRHEGFGGSLRSTATKVGVEGRSRFPPEGERNVILMTTLA
jgi:hypothetical protein